MEVVLEMSFLALSNVKIKFVDWELNWKTYTLDEVLLKTKQVQIIDQRKFAVAALS